MVKVMVKVLVMVMIMVMVKATALVSIIGLDDMVHRANRANRVLPLEAFGTAAVIYLTLPFALVGIFRLLERRLLRHLQAERPAGPANPAMPLAH